MKCISRISIFVLIMIVFSTMGLFVFANSEGSLALTPEEKEWLADNKNRTFVLGIDPYSGMEYFEYKGEEKGYLVPLTAIIEKDLGIKIKLEATKSWGEVYSGLQEGSVDILFGANETPERDKIMAFTRPVYKNPYAIIAKKEGSIHTIGDIDRKTVGFIQDDVIMDLLPGLYKNVKYYEKHYYSQEEGIAAVNNGEVDAFITSGGPVIYDYIYRFPNLKYVFKLSSITSDMTLSTRKNESILAGILDKEIQQLGKDKLSSIINQGEIEYNIKIMNLTDKERQWLKDDGKAVVGVTKDYLPFDYFENGVYKGISGEIIKEISRKTGIKFTTYYSDFDTLTEKLKKGEIHVLNIAKTEDRMKDILYPRPYSLERDIIVGRKDSKDVRDIFGLEGKRVAVIKGFWHYEHLKKNLTQVDIIETNTIQESLKLVHQGKADYLIENPTVVRYYIEELQLYDLGEKGVTSTDSYLYYGITKFKPELASIIDKVLPLMDMDELSKIGYEEVPHADNKAYLKRLVLTIIGLGILLVLIILYVMKLIRDLIKEKTESELLRQREQFLYTDTLTNLHNRNYFNQKIKDTLDQRLYPQTVIVADMNNLKIVNDKFGHHIGDELLKGFAEVLKASCPEESLIFRMGGDEFHILLENTNEAQALEIIARIGENAVKKNIAADAVHIIHADAAFGYATRHFDEDFDELVKTADQRMYGDKKRRKDD